MLIHKNVNSKLK